MRIGVLLCAYNCGETIRDCVKPWFLAKHEIKEHEFIISAVSVPFAEYREINKAEPDETTDFLDYMSMHGDIDYLVQDQLYISEAEARDMALSPLLPHSDVVILVDGDEIYTLDQIRNIINFMVLDPWVSWFSFSLKNYVFNKNTYLLKPFTPPRAFRVKTGGYTINRFTWDNDIEYIHYVKGEQLSYRQLPTKIIPPSVAFIKHYTWLSNEKTRLKIEYQLKHFKGVCGYRWNSETNSVEFNPDHYQQIGESIPEVFIEKT